MNFCKPLLSRWGRTIDRICPWNNYPRPQLKRNNWLCLNGIWQYIILDDAEEYGCDPEYSGPEKFDGEILVPFSPESLLSGAGRQLLPGQTLWYRRDIDFDGLGEGMRLLLHFGAVDQQCDVYVNGSRAGSHEGGYWPFTFDISKLIRKGTNCLSVAVKDHSDTGLEAYGKQKLNRGGIWYTAQSGIWQTVWLETVPEQHITDLKITPCYDAFEVEFNLEFSLPDDPPIFVRIFSEDLLISEGKFKNRTFRLPVPQFRSWSPDDPFLYTVKISTGAPSTAGMSATADVSATADSDEVESYFGMRKFGAIKGADGKVRFSLNGKAIFLSGLLDQGYWSDGLYTAPGDEAMLWELSEVKRLGFNMLRKHIKIEPLRWYYHCDRLGILVWQDFVNGGGPYGKFTSQYLPFIGIHLPDNKSGFGSRGFGRQNKKGREIFERDMERTVKLLGNAVSLSVWVPFNEGWGQYEARRITDNLRKIDNTRLVDHASGWHDQLYGDFVSFHVYYKPFFFKPISQNRIHALTEFGGYSFPVKDHMASEELFGYRMLRTEETFARAIKKLYKSEVIPVIKRGLSAAIYTQLSDVEDEINGLFTWDREKLKIDPSVLQAINRELSCTKKEGAKLWLNI